MCLPSIFIYDIASVLMPSTAIIQRRHYSINIKQEKNITKNSLYIHTRRMYNEFLVIYNQSFSLFNIKL